MRVANSPWGELNISIKHNRMGGFCIVNTEIQEDYSDIELEYFVEYDREHTSDTLFKVRLIFEGVKGLKNFIKLINDRIKEYELEAKE